MDFRAHVSEEKKRLAQQQGQAQKRKSEIESQLSDLAGELQGIDGELAAIEAYEKAVGDIRPSRARRVSKVDAALAKSPRSGRKVSRRAEVLSVIASFGSAGVSRGDIILTLNVKGERSAEQSVSNALAALKKIAAVAHRDGKYIATPEYPATEKTPAPSTVGVEPVPNASCAST